MSVLKKNILVIAPTMFSADYGGASRIIEHIKALNSLGFRTNLYTYTVHDKLSKELHINANELPLVPRFFQGAMFDRCYLDVAMALNVLMKSRFRPAFILAYNQEAAVISKISNKFKVPVIVDVQGIVTEEIKDLKNDKIRMIFKTFEQKILNDSSLITISNPFIADFLNAKFGIDRKKVKTMIDTVDTDLFKPRSKDNSNVKSLRIKLGIKDNMRVVLYVGSFSSTQGTDILIKAAKYVLDRERNVLFILGGGRWSKNYEAFVKLSANLSISQSLKFIPSVDYVKDFPYLLNIADIGVAPKLFSLQSHGKLPVYMSAGLPTVVFDSPINRLFLDSLGLYAKDITVEALGESILSGLNVTAETLRYKLRERALEHFSMSNLISNMTEVSNSVLS